MKNKYIVNLHCPICNISHVDFDRIVHHILTYRPNGRTLCENWRDLNVT